MRSLQNTWKMTMTQKSMPFSDYGIFNIGTSGMIVHQGAKNSLWRKTRVYHSWERRQLRFPLKVFGSVIQREIKNGGTSDILGLNLCI